MIPRTFVVHLQQKVERLEATLASLSVEPPELPDAESKVRGAGYVRFKEYDEPRILGPSSGIALTRLVMEFAKKNMKKHTIKDIVPDIKAQQIRERFTREGDKPTSKVYPLISNVAAASLPTRELTNNLVNVFNKKAQYLLPTLHEPSFWSVVEDVYSGSVDGYKNFTLRIVIAISMQKLDPQYAGLADSYYLAALPFLEQAIKPMDLGTLQCFALMAQYSLLTPTRTAAYWVVGFAARLCQELGITEEATIELSGDGNTRGNALQIDMRRRLFWIITSMELGLAHSLGRPSAFGTTFDHIDVAFFEPVDDQFIGSSGIQPSSPISTKKLIAIHFFKMRLLQAEIRRKLYLAKRPTPENDQDPWFQLMEKKTEDWMNGSPKNDDGSGLSFEWFQVRYNTMVVFLHRPTPQVPEPTSRSALKCFRAAAYNIQKQREQVLSKSIDFTWVFTQSVCMALNTILWSLSYPDIRSLHPKDEVKVYVDSAFRTILLAAERWPGVESALGLYDHLVAACLASYQPNDQENLPPTPTSLRSAQSSPNPTHLLALSGHQRRESPEMNLPDSNQYPFPTFPSVTSNPLMAHQVQVGNEALPSFPTSSEQANNQNATIGNASNFAPTRGSAFDPMYGSFSFDPMSMYNPFPSMDPQIKAGISLRPDLSSHLSSVGEQYSQYLHAPYLSQFPLQALSQNQQMELMNDLESVGLGNT